jgi:hypothetical protein
MNKTHISTKVPIKSDEFACADLRRFSEHFLEVICFVQYLLYLINISVRRIKLLCTTAQDKQAFFILTIGLTIIPIPNKNMDDVSQKNRHTATSFVKGSS